MSNSIWVVQAHQEDGSDKTPTIATFADLLENQLQEPQLAGLVRFLGQIEAHPNGMGSINVVAGLKSIQNKGHDEYLRQAKLYMGIEDRSKYDRFLHNIWEKYIKSFSPVEKVVLDENNISTEKETYRSIMADIRILSLYRNYETWPTILKPGETIEDF